MNGQLTLENNKWSERGAAAGEQLARGLVYLVRHQRALCMLALFALTMLEAAVPALAQRSGSGGITVYGQDKNAPIKAVAIVVNIIFWLALAIGAGGIVLGIWNGISGQKPWGKIMWGGASLMAGGIVAFIDSLGKDPNLVLPDIFGD